MLVKMAQELVVEVQADRADMARERERGREKLAQGEG